MPSCPATARGGRTAWVPMALGSAPGAGAAHNGGMPGAARVIWPPPPMRARKAEGPPSNVKILASMPYLAKMPVSWATHTGMCTRLGGVVGMATPTILSFGCAAPAPTVTARKAPAASTQIDRTTLLPITRLPHHSDDIVYLISLVLLVFLICPPSPRFFVSGSYATLFD